MARSCSGVCRRPDAPAPRTVVFAETPEDACIRVRVAPVERVLVVQVLQQLERLLISRAPLDDLLAPEHPRVIVYLAGAQQFSLRRVPQRVISLRGFDLCARQNRRARVCGVVAHRPLRPIGQRVERLVVRVEARHVVAEFAAHDHLFEVRILRRLWRIRPGHRGDHLVRREEAEVQVGTEPRASVNARLAAEFVVVRQDVFDEMLEARATVLGAAVIERRRRDGMVYRARGDEPRDVLRARVARLFRAINFEFGRAA